MSASPKKPSFRRYTIHTAGPAERVLCVVGDLNNDGIPEIVIASRRPSPELYWLARTESGEWKKYLIDDTFPSLDAGGVLFDVDGDGDLDFIAGQDVQGDRLYWWECPDNPTRPWVRREICQMPGHQSHDQIVGDFDCDGHPELIFWNQRASTLFWVPIPPDPRVSPWPGVQPIATGVREEGLAIADVDGDGRRELIAGQSWYRPVKPREGIWERYPFAEGFVATRVAAADFAGDGRSEIILAEGDASLHGRTYGRLVRLRPGSDPTRFWESELLHDRLLDPHSLVVADFDGDGRPDLFVGELGMPSGDDPHPPAQRIYWNRDGRFEEEIIDSGLGTHESKAIEIDGRIGIVGKPYRNMKSAQPRGPEIDSIHLWLPE